MTRPPSATRRGRRRAGAPAGRRPGRGPAASGRVRRRGPPGWRGRAASRAVRRRGHRTRGRGRPAPGRSRRAAARPGLRRARGRRGLRRGRDPGRLAGRGGVPSDTGPARPGARRVRGRRVRATAPIGIADDHGGPAPLGSGVGQRARHAPPRGRRPDDGPQARARHVAGDVERADAPAGREPVPTWSLTGPAVGNGRVGRPCRPVTVCGLPVGPPLVRPMGRPRLLSPQPGSPPSDGSPCRSRRSDLVAAHLPRGRPRHDPGGHAHPPPAGPPVGQHPRWALRGRHVPPAPPVAGRDDDPARPPPVVRSRPTARHREGRPEPGELLVARPVRTGHPANSTGGSTQEHGRRSTGPRPI